ncbi:MAG: hypothetical protein U0984_02005, partial [Prosthecobacter sp.]|nr:hypothetical protein [Prosthecobacter sp.]
MNRRFLLAFAPALLVLPLSAQVPAATSAVVIKAVTDRADALYKVGETATFVINVTENGVAAK